MSRKERHAKIRIKLQLAGYDVARKTWPGGQRIRRAIVVFYEPAYTPGDLQRPGNHAKMDTKV